MVAISCHREVEVIDPMPSPSEDVTAETTPLNVRTYDEALAIAEDALKMVDGDDTRSANKRRIMRNSGQVVSLPVTRGGEDVGEQPIMYVFNNENNEGFTVVAADRSQQALVAVTERGNYTYGEPTGVEPFDDFMDNAISTLSIIGPPSLPNPPIIDSLDSSPISYTVYYNEDQKVGPLLKTKWGQDGIYGTYCDNGIAGCVATALGQIMAYHKHPAYLTLSFISDDVRQYFNWDRILTHTQNYECDCSAPHEQIGLLLREIGERVDMNYDNGESGTNITKVKNALPGMGYNSPSYLEFSNSYDILDEIMADIDNKKPVYMRGQTLFSGHAWVVDGYHHYKNGYAVYSKNVIVNPEVPTLDMYILEEYNVEEYDLLHFNWGWDGSCDGWFNVGCYKMNQAYKGRYDNRNVTNSYTNDYKYDLKILYNIEPNRD